MNACMHVCIHIYPCIYMYRSICIYTSKDNIVLIHTYMYVYIRNIQIYRYIRAYKDQSTKTQVYEIMLSAGAALHTLHLRVLRTRRHAVDSKNLEYGPRTVYVCVPFSSLCWGCGTIIFQPSRLYCSPQQRQAVLPRSRHKLPDSSNDAAPGCHRRRS